MIDPGWLFLLSGLALIGATVLIPAQADLEDARWLRDRALLIEQHREERIRNYEDYLGALRRMEPALVLSLTQVQLNQLPEGKAIIPGTAETHSANASVFPPLEPGTLRMDDRRVQAEDRSMLSRLAMGERSRLWVLGLGAACILFGLLPVSRRNSGVTRGGHEDVSAASS